MAAHTTAAVQAFLEEVMLESGHSPRNVFAAEQRAAPEDRADPFPSILHLLTSNDQRDAFGAPVVIRRIYRVAIRACELDEVIAVHQRIVSLAATRTGGRVRLTGEVTDGRITAAPVEVYFREVTITVNPHAQRLLPPRVGSSRIEYGRGVSIRWGNGGIVRFG